MNQVPDGTWFKKNGPLAGPVSAKQRSLWSGASADVVLVGRIGIGDVLRRRLAIVRRCAAVVRAARGAGGHAAEVLDRDAGVEELAVAGAGNLGDLRGVGAGQRGAGVGRGGAG